MRKKLFIYNTISAIIKQTIVIICGFILPKYILLYYGSEVNGLLTSITQFLSFISFLELGIGPVIQSNLYKPLSINDYNHISEIVVSAEKFFRKIAGVFLIYIFILFMIFPQIIDSSYNVWYSGSLLLIISISTFMQYYFGITYQLLLNADQRLFIPNILTIITIAINTGISVLLIRAGYSIHFVKLVTTVIYIMRPIGQIIYVNNHYKINKNLSLKEEPIKQKWNGFAQHLASVVVTNTDVTVLTLFSTMNNVSVYSVYFNIVYGIESIVMTLVGGLESLWGNMIANNEMKNLSETFEQVECIMHMGCTFLFTVTGILLIPFIKVYTIDITDTNYLFPIFGGLLVISYGIQCLRVPYFRIIKAAGHYKETQKGSFIQMTINIVLSVILVFKFGLNGVAIGTLVAMIYHTTYFAWYLRKNILSRKFILYIRHIIIDIIVVIVSIFLCHHIKFENINYLAWILMAIKVGLICATVCFVVNVTLYNKVIKKLIITFKKIKV